MATRYYFRRNWTYTHTGGERDFYRAGIDAPLSPDAIEQVEQESPPIAFTADGLIDPDNVGALSGITTLNGRAAGPIIATPALRATVAGTANARTLTTGAALSSIPTGFAVRFRAPSANTGAATINVDGNGAVACRTITGVALPAGYIRSDVDTVAIYDGTFWVLDRQMQRGSNANGEFTRGADGTQECWGEYNENGVACTMATGAVFRADPTRTITFPASFAGQLPILSVAATRLSGSWDAYAVWTSRTVSILNFLPLAFSSRTYDFSMHWSARGRWY